MRINPRILWSCAALALAALPIERIAADTADAKVAVSPDGTVELSQYRVPQSPLLSPAARAYVTQHLEDMQHPERREQVDGVPRFMADMLARARILYPLTRKDTRLAGVHVYDYTARSSDARNAHRVLINLHGGGFSGCWPGCAELESIPIAGRGHIRVISIDYREAPRYRFPAASEDVAAVYRELLKRYRAQDIGIYGCSAGGLLTAESVAWLQQHGLPRPGAVGIFCAGAAAPGSAGFVGDANYVGSALGEANPRPLVVPAGTGYFAGARADDPLVSPLVSEALLAHFPPTLVISGSRDIALSSAIYTHAQLVKHGVSAELHVWEGLFHGFFYNPDIPESQDCYDVIVRFFAERLGGS